jgi:O-antigen/teichoic acid export membrane protein
MKIKLSAVKKNLIANFFGIGVQLFTQIILIPLYLIFWDIDTYSDWIILTAISSFFAMSDVGLNSVTINQFVMQYAEGDRKECRSLLTNNYLLILIVFSVVLLGSSLYVYFVDISKNLGLHAVSRQTATVVFLLLISHIFIGMASAVLDAIYRAVSLNHKAVYIGNIVRLVEGLIIMISLIFHLSLTTMVLFYLLPRVISFVFKLIDTKKHFDYSFQFKDVNGELFKKVLLPSLTFMSFPLGNALIFQGFSLIVNKYFGAEILVLYNTTRTLTSFLTQMLGAILQAVWPEFSIAYGKKDIQRMRELHRKAFVVATSAAIFISIFLLIFGNYIYSLWTQGKVEFDFSLMLAFLIVLIFRNIWSTSSVALMATNKHSKMGLLYVFFSVLSIGVAITLAIFYPSITLNVYCLLIIEIGLCIYTLKRAMELTEDNFGDLVSSFKYIFIDYKEIFKRKFIKTI